MNAETLFVGANEARRHQLAGAGELVIPTLTQYVLGEMPQNLREVREGEMTYDALAKKHYDVLTGSVANSIVDNTDLETAKSTQVDLLFMLGGYLPPEDNAYGYVPKSLADVIRLQRDRFGLPDHMDYEMIIDQNTADSRRFNGLLRVFSDEEFGGEEQHFYMGHALAEPHIKDAAYRLRGIVDTQTEVSASDLAPIADNMRSFNKYMGAYKRLSTEAFSHFRPYIAPYPDGAKNASGAFMPSVQLMELALHGPMASFTEYLNPAMPYFPAWSRPEIEDWYAMSKAGNNVADKLEAGTLLADKAAIDILSKGIVERFISFRKSHLKITRDQIPEAFEGKAVLSPNDLKTYGERSLAPKTAEETGSGGYDIQNILANSVFRLEVFQERLERL